MGAVRAWVGPAAGAAGGRSVPGTGLAWRDKEPGGAGGWAPPPTLNSKRAAQRARSGAGNAGRRPPGRRAPPRCASVGGRPPPSPSPRAPLERAAVWAAGPHTQPRAPVRRVCSDSSQKPSPVTSLQSVPQPASPPARHLALEQDSKLARQKPRHV
ncbi:H/ACA ribonucleoprotein complex non-core subunit NAF1-like isoform X1 [Manis pentadactyla]|uniref:H/ACA ribonucleoprotein complex non-core subunit NAF1-like isoform X1 n=1 Tax=Manis pentadactyla TaxID=143292 RepID=UPI00255D1115|nr:H/ACA ribonucleoprotein complex non-core subunit NAF1-like isoform X1 [Manis pentadactyla]